MQHQQQRRQRQQRLQSLGQALGLEQEQPLEQVQEQQPQAFYRKRRELQQPSKRPKRGSFSLDSPYK
jgi:hypothetical protein